MPVTKFSKVYMNASKYKIFLPLLGLLLAGITACGTAERAAEIPAAQTLAVKTPTASNANQTAAVPPQTNVMPTSVSPSDSVKVRAAEIKLRAGETAEAIVEIVVAEGYHISTGETSSKYLRPTRLKIEPAANFAFGECVYPAGAMKKFDFAEEPIAVYENTIAVKIPIRAARNAKIGQTTLRGSAQAQPCNDNACFPSRTIEFSLPVQITR